MADKDRLEERLFSIMRRMGWDGALPKSYLQAEDKLAWCLLKIEELIEQGSGGASGIDYITVPPTEDNTSGKLELVVLASEPETKYNGYIYVITESEA